MNTAVLTPYNHLGLEITMGPSMPFMNLSDINDTSDITGTGISPLDPNNEKDRERLAQRIARRPSKDDLKLRNIIRVQSVESVASIPANPIPQPNQPPVAVATNTTSIKERSNTLRSCLKKRPERQELMDKNILPEPKIDSSLASTADKLRRAQISDALESRLATRPNPEEMISRLKFVESVEVLPTFRKTEYNRKPDTNSTYRKLTPKLKMEIREELNSFKRDEMSVHSDSAGNTAFH